MRITFVEQNGSGGLIHYAYQLCTALANQGHQVTLVTARAYELSQFPHNFKVENRLNLWPIFQAKVATQQQNGFEKIYRKLFREVRRAPRAIKLLFSWIDLTRYLVNSRPDIILFGSINFPFETFFLHYLKQRGLILTQVCHEFEHREYPGRLSKIIDKSLGNIYQQFTIIFFHANQYRDRFLSIFKIPKEKTFLIQHGNEDFFLSHAAKLDDNGNLKERYALKTNEPVILFFGLIAPSKGLPLLIKAFEIVCRQNQAKLIIAGYPTKQIDMDALIDMVNKAGISGQVIFDTRYIPLGEVPQLIGLSNIVVFPYLTNTQSGSLQVAYSFGRPVIATNVGGLAETVEDGKSGFLVPVDNPDVFAEKIIYLLNNPQVADQMGQYAKHLSNTLYNWDNVAEKITTVYKSILGK